MWENVNYAMKLKYSCTVLKAEIKMLSLELLGTSLKT